MVYNTASTHVRMDDEINQEKAKRVCGHCQRQIQLGEDVFALEQGVIGPRGLVPLERPIWFCDGECAARYFSDEEISRLPRRVP